MSEYLDRILEEMCRKGSTFNKNELIQIKKKVLESIKKKDSIHDCLMELTTELEEKSSEFIYQTNQVISGLSSCIYLPNQYGGFSITVFGGKTRYDKDANDIDEKTIFDLASITKLYTFLLTIRLIEKGYLKREDKISVLDERFIKLEDYTVEDVLKMSGVIKTNRLIASSRNKEEAIEVLRTTYVADNDKEKNCYTDLGFIILSKVIEKIVSEKNNRDMSYEEIMNEYLLIPWGLDETMFNPDKEKYCISGNGNKDGVVHDPKSKILGGNVGSAGMFATNQGINLLASKLLSVSYVNYSRLAGTKIYQDSNKGYGGIYQKHELGLNKTFVPNEYAKGSFASQGFTGSLAVFDYKNQIHNHILVNSIKDREAKKPDNYLKVFTVYQIILTEITLKMYLISRYYEMMGYNDGLEIKGKVK